MPFYITPADLLTIVLLLAWSAATIIWGSVCMNLAAAGQSGKQTILGLLSRSLPVRACRNLSRFPRLHLAIWLADVVVLCWALNGWWQSLR